MLLRMLVVVIVTEGLSNTNVGYVFVISSVAGEFLYRNNNGPS